MSNPWFTCVFPLSYGLPVVAHAQQLLYLQPEVNTNHAYRLSTKNLSSGCSSSCRTHVLSIESGQNLGAHGLLHGGKDKGQPSVVG